MTNKYFSNPTLVTAAQTAVNALEGAGRAYEDVVEVLWDALIEAETEDGFPTELEDAYRLPTRPNNVPRFSEGIASPRYYTKYMKDE